MVEKFISCFSCLLIAYAFFAMGVEGKDRTDPITYYSGDDTLKVKIKDLKNYNGEMARMYKYWALSWIVVGALFFPLPMLPAIIMVFAAGTVGVIISYRTYKSILRKYS